MSCVLLPPLMYCRSSYCDAIDMRAGNIELIGPTQEPSPKYAGLTLHTSMSSPM